MNEQALTDEMLRAWRKLADEATPGKWRIEDHFNKHLKYPEWWVRPATGAPVWGICQTGATDAPKAKEDAEFIAAARSAVPALLDEVERLRQVIAEYLDTGISTRDLAAVIGREMPTGEPGSYKLARGVFSVDNELDTFTFTKPQPAQPVRFFDEEARKALDELP